MSGFVSLTLTPMLCGRFLRPGTHLKHGRMYMALENVFEWGRRSYGWTLRATIRHGALTMLVSLGLLVATVYLFQTIPKGFIPSVDTGQIQGQIETLQGIGYDAAVAHVQQVVDVVRRDPNVQTITSNVGFSGGGQSTSTTSRLTLELKPRDQRAVTADDGMIIENCGGKLNAIPGVRVYLTNPPAIRIGGVQGRSAYQYALLGASTAELYEYAPKLEAELHKIPELVDVTSDLQLANPQVNVTLDRDQIAALGLTVDQVENAMSGAYSSSQVGTIYAPTNQYQILMRVLPQYQDRPDALSLLYVRAPSGKLIFRSTSSRASRKASAPDGKPHGPAAVGDAVVLAGAGRGARRRARSRRQGGETLPFRRRSSATPQGTAQAFQDSLPGLGVILMMAIFVIYIVLGILYESFIHPITILSGCRRPALGALATLMIFHVDLNLYAFVGVIMLVGLVKKNGIMMIDFAIEAQRNEGKSPADAIYEACMVRFRPIMMTTMAALVGTLPIAMGLGAGAEARRPLGLAVVGGLLVSQTLTLYITPVFYIYMENMQDWLKGRKSVKQPVLAVVSMSTQPRNRGSGIGDRESPRRSSIIGPRSSKAPSPQVPPPSRKARRCTADARCR